MVVVGQAGVAGVAGDAGERAWFGEGVVLFVRFLGRCWFGAVVIGGGADDGAGVGEELSGVESLPGGAGEVAHGGVSALAEVALEGIGIGGIERQGGCDADKVEADLAGPGLDLLAGYRQGN